jgi:heterodisulfide reductase subunit A
MVVANPPSEELRIGVFVCDCGLNIAGAVDTQAVTDWAETLPDVVCAVRNKYTCADPGQNEIKDAIRQHHLNRVVVASCSPRQHEPTFRQCVVDAGLNPYLVEMANLREHCSWVHPNDWDNATAKAKDLVASALARARYLQAQEEMTVPVSQRALVIGGCSSRKKPPSVGSWLSWTRPIPPWTALYEFSALRPLMPVGIRT